YRFNVPLLVRSTTLPPTPKSFFSLDRSSVVIDTVKKAEDSDALMLRLYEAHGARGIARLSSPLPVQSVVRCSLLEDELAPLDWLDGGVDIPVSPFEVITLKLVC